MKNDSFTNALMSKNENDLHEWLAIHGKSAKPVSPIFFLGDESEKEWNNIRSNITGGKPNEQESREVTQE